MKLWVDDIRDAPDESWEIARTSREAIAQLSLAAFNNETVELLSLDHDLGGLDTSRSIVLTIADPDSRIPWPERIRVHSANPVGVEWLEGTIRRNAPPGTLQVRHWGTIWTV